MNTNLMHKGIKWVLVLGLAMIISLPACRKCDTGKAKILVAVYKLNIADSTLITDAIVRVKCGTDQDPGTSIDAYDFIDTTDYTGKVEFDNLRRRTFFLYATADIPTSVDVVKGDTDWTKLNNDDPVLYEKLESFLASGGDPKTFPDSIIMKLYVDDTYIYQSISGTNTLEITNKQGETTIGVVLCAEGGNTCVEGP